MVGTKSARERFAELASGDDGEIDLGEAALPIARVLSRLFLTAVHPRDAA